MPDFFFPSYLYFSLYTNIRRQFTNTPLIPAQQTTPTMRSLIILSISLCIILLIQSSLAQRPNRQRPRPANGGGRGSGGPSGIRFPTDDDEPGFSGGPGLGGGSGGLKAGKWPGGFYGGSNW